MTIKHGSTKAENIGHYHELGEETVRESDMLKDQYNNAIGRRIGEKLGKNATDDDIYKAVEEAIINKEVMLTNSLKDKDECEKPISGGSVSP